MKPIDAFENKRLQSLVNARKIEYEAKGEHSASAIKKADQDVATSEGWASGPTMRSAIMRFVSAAPKGPRSYECSPLEKAYEQMIFASKVNHSEGEPKVYVPSDSAIGALIEKTAAQIGYVRRKVCDKNGWEYQAIPEGMWRIFGVKKIVALPPEPKESPKVTAVESAHKTATIAEDPNVVAKIVAEVIRQLKKE